MSNSDLDNSRMEIPVSETLPGPSGIKIEPKEDCEDLLSAFTVDPTPVKIENDDISDNSDEYDETLSEDYTVDVKKLKTEHHEDSKEWLNKPLIKSEENDQLAVSGEDQDDNFTEDSNIKSEEMHIKEDDGFNEPGISPNSYDQDDQEIRRTTKRTYPVFQCPDCDFNTTRKRNMARHGARHKREQAAKDGFTCTKCNFKATTKGLLNAHLRRHLSSEQATEYNCDICEYTTIYKGRIDRHLRKQHTKKGGVAPPTLYKCPECDYFTFQKGRMELHMLIHGNRNDVTMLKCYHCSYETVNKTYLKSHLKRHLRSEQATEYNYCDICEYKTLYKTSIERHLQAHTKKGRIAPQNKYACPECDYTNLQEERMELHMLIHGEPNDGGDAKRTSEEHLQQVSAINLTESVDNYKLRCQDCDYKTNWSSSFTVHLKQHEKPKKKRAARLQ